MCGCLITNGNNGPRLTVIVSKCPRLKHVYKSNGRCLQKSNNKGSNKGTKYTINRSDGVCYKKPYHTARIYITLCVSRLLLNCSSVFMRQRQSICEFRPTLNVALLLCRTQIIKTKIKFDKSATFSANF